MAFVDASFTELKVRERHDSEAYAKITNDAFQNVAKKNKGSATALVDDKVTKMISSFYATLLEGPLGTNETAEKILALIAKSRLDRKKAEDAAKNVMAAGGAKAGVKGDVSLLTRESKFEYNNKGKYEDDEDYYEEEEEEEEEEIEVAKPVAPVKTLAEIEAERKAAAAAFVMPKKTGAKTLRL